MTFFSLKILCCWFGAIISRLYPVGGLQDKEADGEKKIPQKTRQILEDVREEDNKRKEAL